MRNSDLMVIISTMNTIEIAYRIPGKSGFRSRTFKTQAAAERWIDKLLAREGSDVEIRWAV